MNQSQNNGGEILNEHRKTRIAAIFNHSYFLGGGEVSFFELIRKLDPKWFEANAIVPGEGEIKRKLSNHNIDAYIHPFPTIKRIYNGSPLIALINLIKLIKRKKIEIIHANGSRASLYAGVIGKILNIPVIWHVRETVQDIFWYDGLLGRLSSKIICVSKSVQKKRLGRFGKVINNKITVVYNGVDTKIFTKDLSARSRVRKELGLNGQILFGIIGNFVPLKGQDFFLKGFAEAKRREPNLPAKTLLIGRPLDMGYFKSLTKLTRKLDIKSDVIYKNYRPDIQEILSALDVFAIPSRREGFSRSMLEAMSCGLPVIGTKISEIEEAIVDKKNGILVDFMHIGQIASAIITLCKNNRMRNEIGTRNRLDVKKKFDLASHASKIESIYLHYIRKDIHI